MFIGHDQAVVLVNHRFTECFVNPFTEHGIDCPAARELVLEFRGDGITLSEGLCNRVKFPGDQAGEHFEIVPATAREEQDIKIIRIQPLGFTGISGKMDPLRDDPAAALDPEFQEMPVRIPFCLDGKNILEERGLVFSLPLFIDLDLKVPDFRVGWLEDAVLVQLRYIHERDIDD